MTSVKDIPIIYVPSLCVFDSPRISFRARNLLGETIHRNDEVMLHSIPQYTLGKGPRHSRIWFAHDLHEKKMCAIPEWQRLSTNNQPNIGIKLLSTQCLRTKWKGIVFQNDDFIFPSIQSIALWVFNFKIQWFCQSQPSVFLVRNCRINMKLCVINVKKI